MPPERKPDDLRVWHYKHILGWATRRIAPEVGISQATVVRTLQRLEENPPTDEEIAAYMIPASTPPGGIPVLRHRRVSLAGLGGLSTAIGVSAVLLAVAVSAVLFAAAISLLNHTAGAPGPAGPPGARGPAGPVASTDPAWLCITTDPVTGNVTKVTTRTDSQCAGAAQAVKIP